MQADRQDNPVKTATLSSFRIAALFLNQDFAANDGRASSAPRRLTYCILFTVLLIASILLAAAFAANLVPAFSVRSFHLPFNT